MEEVWSGTISSDGPSQQGPITVLSLYSTKDHLDWKEGFYEGLESMKNAIITIDAIHYKIENGEKVYSGGLSGIRTHNYDGLSGNVFNSWGRGYWEGQNTGRNKKITESLPYLCKELGIKYIDFEKKYNKKNGTERTKTCHYIMRHWKWLCRRG